MSDKLCIIEALHFSCVPVSCHRVVVPSPLPPPPPSETNDAFLLLSHFFFFAFILPRARALTLCLCSFDLIPHNLPTYTQQQDSHRRGSQQQQSVRLPDCRQPAKWQHDDAHTIYPTMHDSQSVGGGSSQHDHEL
jgi:hypothetical protein